jgi:hypothetical protein
VAESSGLYGKLQQFYRSVVVHDHGYTDAFRGGAYLTKKPLANECGVKIIYFKGNMGHGANEIGNPAIRIEPHPFDTIRTRRESRYMDLQMLEMDLIWPRDGGWDAEVVIPPTALRNRCGRFVVEPRAGSRILCFHTLQAISLL